MKKSWTLLLLFVFLAPFLMSNAPSPYPYPDYYEDYTATPLTVEQDNEYYLYKTEITNTGEGYIDLYNAHLKFTVNNIYLHNSHPQRDVVLPSGTKELIFVASTEFPLTDYELGIYAYVNNVHKTTFSNITDFTRHEEDSFNRNYWGVYYEYSFSVDYERDEDYTSELIVTYKYNDEIYTQYMQPSSMKKVYFKATEKVDADDIEFLDFYNVLGRKRSGGLNWGMFLFVALLFSTLVVFVIGVPIGIAVLTIYLVKKNRARKKETEQESENNRHH